MSLICMNIRLVLRSDAMFSSGHSTPGGEDIALRVDQDGMPFLPGATLTVDVKDGELTVGSGKQLKA